jgi:hypothetical protein
MRLSHSLIAIRVINRRALLRGWHLLILIRTQRIS